MLHRPGRHAVGRPRAGSDNVVKVTFRDRDGGACPASRPGAFPLGAAITLVEQSALVSKVRFPRETVPAAVVTVQLVPYFSMLVVLLPVALILR